MPIIPLIALYLYGSKTELDTQTHSTYIIDQGEQSMEESIMEYERKHPMHGDDLTLPIWSAPKFASQLP